MIIPQSKIFEIIKRYHWLILILIIFILLRLPGISLPYYQDEWKNVASASTIQSAGSFFAHPPLMQIAFVTAYQIFGVNNFRVFPLLLSMLSIFLLYATVKRRSNEKAAIWTTIIYTICFYNILGSLQPDADGSVLPFLFLLSVYAYDRLNGAIDFGVIGYDKNKWLILLISLLLAGFLFKLSFILVVAAILIDYIWRNHKSITLKKSLLFLTSLIGFVITYVLLLYLIRFVYPAFDMSIMLGHANQFSDGLGRNWIQIFVQGIKAIFYLSPLLIIPLVFTSREIINEACVFIVYTIIGLIFYFIVFDFSRGALDKYLMFLIVPLSIIVGMILANIFEKVKVNNIWKTLRITIIIGAVLSIVLLLINFLPHKVLPLYPKTLWFSRVFHGQWLMLNPFNGGSGPLGFYVSFLYIVISFLVSTIFGVVALIKKQWRITIVSVLVITGVIYNIVFTEEYLFGKLNGSAPDVLNETILYIKKNNSIRSVITYSDIGNQYLSLIGKYAGRIYATPASESGYREKFAKHVAQGGQFLVIGIPPLSHESFYGKFFAQCDVLFETSSGAIMGTVYSCEDAQRLVDTI